MAKWISTFLDLKDLGSGNLGPGVVLVPLPEGVDVCALPTVVAPNRQPNYV